MAASCTQERACSHDKANKDKQEEGTYAAVSCCSVLVLLVGGLVMIMSGGSLHKNSRALMRKQLEAKRREEEGMYMAVSCFLVLVC